MEPIQCYVGNPQNWNLESKLVNNNFVIVLKENLVSKGQLLHKGKLLHCCCVAHVFNLIVQEGFKAISCASNNIRETVRYVKSSQAHKQWFERMVKKCSNPVDKCPPLDVVT